MICTTKAVAVREHSIHIFKSNKPGSLVFDCLIVVQINPCKLSRHVLNVAVLGGNRALSIDNTFEVL